MPPSFSPCADACFLPGRKNRRTADDAVWAAAEKAAQGIQPRHADGLAPVRGLASGAELTIFDEPSLGLDAVMRERFYDEVVAAHQEGAGAHLSDQHTPD